MLGIACGSHCDACPAAARCGRTPNFCLRGRCEGCADPQQLMAERRRVMEHLGGLDLTWPRPVRHPDLPDLPNHLPVLVQAYADPVDVPWVALHGGRVFGATGRWITPKHRRPLREVYRLGPDTKLALQLYVEDRVLEGFWSARRRIIAELAGMGFDLVLTPNFSVWRTASRLYVIWNQSPTTSEDVLGWEVAPVAHEVHLAANVDQIPPPMRQLAGAGLAFMMEEARVPVFRECHGPLVGITSGGGRLAGARNAEARGRTAAADDTGNAARLVRERRHGTDGCDSANSLRRSYPCEPWGRRRHRSGRPCRRGDASRAGGQSQDCQSYQRVPHGMRHVRPSVNDERLAAWGSNTQP